MALKPFITAGVALASAVMVVAGTPTLLSPMDTKVTATAPTPTKLSQARYDLTTLENVLALTPADYQSAYFDGWGPFVTKANSYGFGKGTAPTGASGVAYMVLDNLVWDGVTPDPAPNLVNYYYELGAGPALYIAAQQIGFPASTLEDVVNTIYSAPTLIATTALGAVAPIPLIGPSANAYLNGFNGSDAGVPGVIAYSVNNVIGRLPAFDPNNIVGFFVGDGADADAATCGDSCNGGNAGILMGNGGKGANGGSGGNAGFFVGNGGDGGNGVAAVYNTTTGKQTTFATNGGNGGWGGFLVGNGGKGGDGGADVNPTTGLVEDGDGSAVGGDGGTGGQGGILSGTGGGGGNGGLATTVNGSAYGGYGGDGGQSGFAGSGGAAGDGGAATAVALDPTDDTVEAVGGNAGYGGNSFSGTSGDGGNGGNAVHTGAPAGSGTGGSLGAAGVTTPLGTSGVAGVAGTVTPPPPAPAAALNKLASASNKLSAAPNGTADSVAKSLKSTKKAKAAKASAGSDSDSK